MRYDEGNSPAFIILRSGDWQVPTHPVTYGVTMNHKHGDPAEKQNVASSLHIAEWMSARFFLQ